MLQLGFITIDLTPLLDAAARSPFAAVWYMFIHGGFLFLLPLLKVAFDYYMLTIQVAYCDTWKWFLLAIDVPKDNIQTPKAVEHIFSLLAGAHSTNNLIEEYIQGKNQEHFSFEIASHEGMVRFYTYTTAQYRDLVEAAVFAQYPDAQISEAEDYTQWAPTHFPNKEWELWGSEFILANKQAYPIRTYPSFEHQLSQEFLDPMSGILEIMNKIGPGEHIWMQVLVRPTDDEWKNEGEKLAKKLVGAKVEHKPSLAEKALGFPSDVLIQMLPELLGPGEHDSKSKEWASLMQFLTPGERTALEAIQMKNSKLGFQCKLRVIYLARKEVYKKSRGASGIIGAIKQFNTVDLNSFKPNKRVWTKIQYLFKKTRVAWRQTAIMKGYKGRSMYRGGKWFILNIEELATIYHFPVMSVRAPGVTKTQSKRMQPPVGLPTEGHLTPMPVSRPMPEPEEEEEIISESGIATEPVFAPASRNAPGNQPVSNSRRAGPPSNLPIG